MVRPRHSSKSQSWWMREGLFQPEPLGLQRLCAFRRMAGPESAGPLSLSSCLTRPGKFPGSFLRAPTTHCPLLEQGLPARVGSKGNSVFGPTECRSGGSLMRGTPARSRRGQRSGAVFAPGQPRKAGWRNSDVGWDWRRVNMPVGWYPLAFPSCSAAGGQAMC